MKDGLPSFDGEVWRYVYRDVRAGAKSVVRWLIEAAVTVPPTLFFLFRHGSTDAPKDYSLERLLAVPLGLVALMLMHLLWSWATASRRIFYDQQGTIRQQREEAESKKSAKDSRAEKYTELISVGAIQMNRDIKADDKLSQWEAEIAFWEQAAFDMVLTDFGEAEAHILTHPVCETEFVDDSWGDGHYRAKLRLVAMNKSLKEFRQRLKQ